MTLMIYRYKQTNSNNKFINSIKTLNGFKNENKNLEKLEMATKIGDLTADPKKKQNQNKKLQ